MSAVRLRHLVLVRHGETEGQSSIRYYGATDVPLSESGRHQLSRVGRALAGVALQAVYTSTLRRTVEAARIIAPDVPAQAIASFDEVHFGEWEGLTREEIAARDPEGYRRWRQALDEFCYPGGEAVPVFRTRVVHAWRRLLPAAPALALVVAHKGVIASIIADMLGLEPAQRAAWPIDLASIHVLEAANGHWRATVVNECRHLADR
jgi:broad specificity phosphatase PhoE